VDVSKRQRRVNRAVDKAWWIRLPCLSNGSACEGLRSVAPAGWSRVPSLLRKRSHPCPRGSWAGWATIQVRRVEKRRGGDFICGSLSGCRGPVRSAEDDLDDAGGRPGAVKKRTRTLGRRRRVPFRRERRGGVFPDPPPAVGLNRL